MARRHGTGSKSFDAIVKFRGRSIFDTASDFPDKTNFNKTLIAGLFSGAPKWLCKLVDDGLLTYDAENDVVYLKDKDTDFVQVVKAGDYLTIDEDKIYVI